MTIYVYKEGIIDTDFPHLGGNSVGIHKSTYCTKSWDFIIKKYNIKSVLDVGSGRGHAAKWFKENGLESIAIEGLKDNVKNAVYPSICIDLTKQSYITNVDLVNCIEVVEHIEEKYINNLLDTICCGKYIFMTHAVPGQDGHHHVNCQPKEYWIEYLESRGFVESIVDSTKIKELAGNAHHISDTGIFLIRKDLCAGLE